MTELQHSHAPVLAESEGHFGIFDLETLADRTAEMLSIQPGQVIWIWASTHSLDFIEALAYRIRAQGAFWTLRLSMQSLSRRIGLDVPEPYLAMVPEHEVRWLEDIDAVIDVRDHGLFFAPDIPLARRRAMATEWIALNDEAARRNCRRFGVTNPTPALASAFGVSHAVLCQRYWQAIDIDYTALGRQQKRFGALLSKTDQVHITSPLGTDLHLRIGQRPVHLDLNDIPRGEVYVAPLEDSANGIAVIDKHYVNGELAERLELTFMDGKVVQADAPDARAVAAFREVLSVSSGDKDVIAEFAIGLNPGVTEAVGDIALDEKIGGSVHIAIGMNANFGGRNKANLHKDLVILRPTVWLDGSMVIDTGVLRPDVQ